MTHLIVDYGPGAAVPPTRPCHATKKRARQAGRAAPVQGPFLPGQKERVGRGGLYRAITVKGTCTGPESASRKVGGLSLDF